MNAADTADGKDVSGPLTLGATTPHLGGFRFWFRCPGQECGRRVAILYVTKNGLLCRRCLGLVYPVQREDRANRLLRKAQNIRERLGGSSNMSLPFPARPKGMHHRTYWRLRRQSQEAWSNSLGIIGKHFDLPPHKKRSC